jgi:N-glycosylase/DNA lyase
MTFVADSELDVAASLSSGQVFRFRKDGEAWIGSDGDNRISAKLRDGGWVVSSHPDPFAVHNFFQLETSLEDVSRSLTTMEPRLAGLISRYRGLRTLRCSSSVETLFSFLCTPNNNMVRIVRMVNALGEYGDRSTGAFPSIHQLAYVSEAELREKGFGYRARSITYVARQLMERPADWLDSLRKAPYEEAHRSLCELHGVGKKVADCVCLFGLWHGEAVPLDVHLWHAACELYFPQWVGTKITDSKYRAASDAFRDRFGKLAGWAQQYLFYHGLVGGRR